MTREDQDKMAKAVLKAYRKGYRHGIQNFAYWQDGALHVGTTGMRLQEAIDNMEKFTNYDPPRI